MASISERKPLKDHGMFLFFSSELALQGRDREARTLSKVTTPFYATHANLHVVKDQVHGDG